VTVRLGAIVAMAENGVIGREGSLPWRLPDDLAHFKAITLGCPVIMGRRTWESLGRPLPGRTNIVLSRAARDFPGAAHAPTFAAAVAVAAATSAPWAWVIGGAEVYTLALPEVARLEVTRVHASPVGDVVFPTVAWAEWTCVERCLHAADDRHAHAFTFESWERATEP
jgi:dihydrofolate reductase